jgi:hypothetical protein
MHLGRDSVVRYLRERGRHEDADRFEQSAPERLHAVPDAELLRRFAIDPSDVEGATFRDLPPRDD